MCLVDNSLYSCNKVATEDNVKEELYDLEQQIQSLESLNCSSQEIVKVLEELKVCYANLKLFEKDAVCEPVETLTCDSKDEEIPLECGSSDNNSCMVLSSDTASKCEGHTCLQSYEETCDGLLLELIGKASEMIKASQYLELCLSQFVWGAYFYEHLKAGQLIAFCDFRLNGTPFWNIAQVLEIYVESYDRSEIETFLKEMTHHTFTDFRTLKRVETGSYDIPSLKEISNMFYVISKVKVNLVTPRCLAEKLCDNIEKCSLATCSYDHGHLIEPQNIRTFLLDNVIQKGRHVVVKCNATDVLWKEGKIIKVAKDCIHVQLPDSILQIDWKDSCHILPDLTLESFEASELPTVSYNVDEMCENTHLQQEDNEKNKSKKECITSEKRFISSNDSFGGWEKYTKGFGSRMLMKMGYKLGEALSPPSWKPCHRPKLIEPLTLCVLRPRAGLNYMKDTTKNNTNCVRGKKRFKKESQEGELLKCRALRLLNQTFLYENKCMKDKKSEGQYDVMCHKSDRELRQELIALEQKEVQFKNEIDSLQKHLERHQNTKVRNKLTMMYTRKLNEKEKELFHLQKKYHCIKNQLQLNQSILAFQSF